jgi:2-polyprenyl-6-hydroxyphenyl methylase/3-demethylubiquinone-9 3-methyltransferase
MSRKKLKTLQCRSEAEILQFFENSAVEYREAHGDANKLLKYRMSKLIEWAKPESDEVVLDVGCGNGHHLMYLAPLIGSGIGVDFSEKMIDSARQATENSQYSSKLQFRVDNARYLNTIPDQSIDLVTCIGSFEHMQEKNTVIKQFYRVIKKGGRLVLMTPNGKYIWYQILAPLFKYHTQHLSTDQFLPAQQLKEKLIAEKFTEVSLDYWTFIPRGDMSGFWGNFLKILDILGRLFKIASYRGGIIARAHKY